MWAGWDVGKKSRWFISDKPVALGNAAPSQGGNEPGVFSQRESGTAGRGLSRGRWSATARELLNVLGLSLSPPQCWPGAANLAGDRLPAERKLPSGSTPPQFEPQ